MYSKKKSTCYTQQQTDEVSLPHVPACASVLVLEDADLCAGHPGLPFVAASSHAAAVVVAAAGRAAAASVVAVAGSGLAVAITDTCVRQKKTHTVQ